MGRHMSLGGQARRAYAAALAAKRRAEQERYAALCGPVEVRRFDPDEEVDVVNPFPEWALARWEPDEPNY